MTLSDSAVIVIVLVCCLSVTALGAALFRHYNPLGDESNAYNTSAEQSQYMRAVRLRNFGFLKGESMGWAKDLESRHASDAASGFYQYGQDATPSGYGYESPYMQDEGYAYDQQGYYGNEPAAYVQEPNTPSTRFG